MKIIKFTLKSCQINDLCRLLKDTVKRGFIFVDGPIGAGKTFFISTYLKQFGLENVTSPTYSLVHTYHTDSQKIVHADLYRLEYATQLKDLELEFYQDELFLIEWGLRFENYLQPQVARLSIETCQSDANIRNYTLTLFDPLGTGYLDKL